MRGVLVVAALVASPVGLIASPGPAAAAQASAQRAADELLAADRAFSTSGASKGLIESIGAMFDDQVVMPAPPGVFAKGKTAAIDALKANPANANAKASWTPVRGGVSADGLHGFTYGFMTITEAGKPDRRAKYLSYWIKRADGWRVVAYKRAPSGEGQVSLTLRPPALPAESASGSVSPSTLESYRTSLAAAEKAFSDRAQTVGLRQAFIENGSPDAMNMGRGADFTFSNAAIGGDMPPEPKSEIHWAADEQVIVAGSGDLGVTIGFIRPHAAPPAGQPGALPFFTIWRRASPQDAWRYVAE